MKILRIVAAGALSYFAYRAWKRSDDDHSGALSQESQDVRSLPDDGARTAPHGDPLTEDQDPDASPPRSTSQSSPGFGAP